MKTKTVRSVKGLLLAAGLLFGLTASAVTGTKVTNLTTLKSMASNGGECYLGGTYLEGGALTETITIPAGKTLTLDTWGYDLVASHAGYVFDVYGTLVIKNTDGTYVSDILRASGFQNDASLKPLFRVNNGGVLTIDPGAGKIIVRDNVGCTGYGGAVQIYGGTFNMYAKTTIQNCSTTSSAGAIYVDGGTFNMNGGTIQNCSSSKSAGGVYLKNYSTGNISGGTIQNCSTVNWAAGIYLHTSTLNMSGGTIQNCTASNQNGGGIWLNDSVSKATLTGGTIIGNKSKGSDSQIQSQGTVTISGYMTIGSGYNQSVNNGTLSKITFDKQGGTGGSNSVDPATYGSAMPAATMPTRNGYTFLGYYDATSAGTQYYKADGTSARNWDKVVAAATLYARWSQNQTLSYNANGHGTAPASVTMTYPNATTAAAALTGVTGYTFSKWNTKADGTGTSYNANAQVKAANVDPTATTLYAIWTANAYTVAFDGNGATGGATASLSCTYDVAFTMPGCGFTKDGGYAFTGRNTAADGSGTAYAAGANCLNLSATQGATVTLYAQWAAEGAGGNPWSVGGDVVAYTNGAGGLVVSGTGAAGDFSKQSPAPWAAFADQIKSVTIADGVTGIGSRFFKGCTRLGTVTGGKNLVSVGENAFYQCMSLETIELENADVLDSLKNAIVYQTAIDAQGKPYVIPRIDIPGYKNVLYGTVDLVEPKWEEVPEGTTMQESGYHFFKFVLKKIGE